MSDNKEVIRLDNTVDVVCPECEKNNKFVAVVSKDKPIKKYLWCECGFLVQDLKELKVIPK